jgi:WD40 repeat protein
LEAKPIAARPVKDWERAWNWVRRHPAVSSLTATVGVSILLGLAGVTWQWRRAEAVNVRLELQQAEDLFSADKSHLALATLARLLRDHPSNRAAAERLINALDQRVFLVPSQGSVPAAAKPSDLSLDGKRRLKLDGVDSFRVVEVLTEQTLLSVPLAHTNPIRSIAFSPDAQRIITASADATAKVWDARSGALLLQLPHRQPVYWAEFSPDGSRIVTATAMWDSAGQLWEATAQLWDATNGLRLGNPMPHLNSINAAHFSPVDGRFVVTASEDYTARVWSGDTGLPVSESARLGSAVEDASFSPDGRQIRLALGSNDIRNFRLTRGFELFAAAKGEAPEVDSRQALEQTLAAFKARLAPKHSGEITSIDLDPTRTVLATASTDKSARLWDARTLQPLADPLVHHTTVNCVRFSPDGLRLVTSTSRPNPRVRLWDVPTAQPLSDWIDSPAPVAAIRFSADGHWIISSAGWKWEIHPESGPLPSWLPALAEGIAGVRYTAGRISEPVPETALLTLQRKVSRLSISEPLVAWANLLWRNDQ